MDGGIAQLAVGIGADLLGRLPDQRKTQCDKLALLIATMLEFRSANLMALLLLLLSVPSCTSGKGADSFCLAAHPIRPTAADVHTMSPSWVQQVLAHDKTGQQLCGWKP